MAGPDTTGVAVRGGRVLETGDVQDLRRRFAHAEVADLGDATIVPGLNDAHMHPGMSAEDLLHADASPERVRTRAELIALLSAEAASTPPGQWIRATRYDHMRTTGGQILDRADLDAISGEHPILVVHVAAHGGSPTPPGSGPAATTTCRGPRPAATSGGMAPGGSTGSCTSRPCLTTATPLWPAAG